MDCMRIRVSSCLFLNESTGVGWGGWGVTTMYQGIGCAIFGVPFFEQKINLGVSFLVKSQVVINSGVSF